MDDLAVQVELDEAAWQRGEDGREVLRRELVERLRAVIGVRATVKLEAPGTLPRTEFKARRVIDNRELYREINRGSA
jgi:phenylacetate-CoA ligase